MCKDDLNSNTFRNLVSKQSPLYGITGSLVWPHQCCVFSTTALLGPCELKRVKDKDKILIGTLETSWLVTEHNYKVSPFPISNPLNLKHEGR